jgi:DNA-binding MarR family transcriptional regulator
MTDSVERDLARGLVGHPTADPVTEAVIARIIQISRQHERVMREVTARHGVSLADCEVVFHLAHSDTAQHTPGQLANAFQITAGSMTSRLDRLERAGFIQRRIDPTNRVNINVALTPAGHALHSETVDDIVTLRRALIGDALPANQLTTLNTLLRRVLTHIEHDHGSGRAAEGTRSDRAPA